MILMTVSLSLLIVASLSNATKTMLLIASDRTPVNTSSLTMSSVNPSGRLRLLCRYVNRV